MHDALIKPEQQNENKVVAWLVASASLLAKEWGLRTIKYKIENSVSYLSTFLNGIQVAIEFDWNLKLDSSLYIKRLWLPRQ